MHVFNDDFIYRDIHGFEDEYQINEIGEVYNKKTSKLCKQKKERHGYMTVSIKRRNMSVHKLLLSSFTLIPTADHMVDHINGLRDDNRLENLRWVTNSENQQNAKLGNKNNSGIKGVRLKPVKCNGIEYYYWIGYIKHQGKSYEKNFPNTDEGFDLACKWRKEMEDKFYTVDKNILIYKTNGDLYSEYFK